ncbi:hypothetical protein ACIQU6_15490 [Streptomyces sp. NPDC090442]|uniref:hypothetical protein n=1 Tax=Streptomyces sp. NPDC090442 TaxID=3365962 RepID=UPI00382735BE
MTPTVEEAVHQARETWRRLGVEQDAVEEMTEELAADLTAAAFDGQSVTDYLGKDVEAIAVSWAAERGLVPVRRRLKETAVAAAMGATVPALAALGIWWVSWSGLLGGTTESTTATAGGGVLWEVYKSPNLGVPLMWVGWVACLLAAFFLIRRTVAAELERTLDPARKATTRAMTKALPLILPAAAVLGGAIGLFGAYAVGYFQLLFTVPIALAGMIGAVAAGAAWVRHRACPPVTVTG